MPIIKSAIKRMRQTAKRRARNVSLKRDIKVAVKSLVAKPTAAGLSAAQSELDTAVKKGLLKKNTAARRKSALARNAKAAGLTLDGTKNAPAKPTATKPVASKTTTKKSTVKTTAKAPVKAAAKPAAKKTAAKTPAKKPAAKK